MSEDTATPEALTEEDAGREEDTAPAVTSTVAPSIKKRLVLVHVLAYPLALVFAVAAAPIIMRMMPDGQLLSVAPELAWNIVARKLVVPALVMFVVAHAVAAPWLRKGADPVRGKRTYAALLTFLFAMGLFGGAASWALLLYK